MKKLFLILLALASLYAAPSLAQFDGCAPGFCRQPTTTVWATFDGVAVNSALSGGNLTGTHSNSTAGGVRSASAKTTGKYYYEITISNFNNLLSGLEVLKSSSAFATGGTFVDETVVIVGNGGGNPFGEIVANSGNSGFALGAITGVTVTIGIAVDVTNSLSWWRLGAAGAWNNNGGSSNPATGAVGVTISGATSGGVGVVPTCLFEGNNTETCSANFGASTFAGVVPSGYVAGWPQ